MFKILKNRLKTKFFSLKIRTDRLYTNVDWNIGLKNLPKTTLVYTIRIRIMILNPVTQSILVNCFISDLGRLLMSCPLIRCVSAFCIGSTIGKIVYCGVSPSLIILFENISKVN